jgi:hypothetical protein
MSQQPATYDARPLLQGSTCLQLPMRLQEVDITGATFQYRIADASGRLLKEMKSTGDSPGIVVTSAEEGQFRINAFATIQLPVGVHRHQLNMVLDNIITTLFIGRFTILKDLIP